MAGTRWGEITFWDQAGEVTGKSLQLQGVQWLETVWVYSSRVPDNQIPSEEQPKGERVYFDIRFEGVRCCGSLSMKRLITLSYTQEAG